MTPRKNLRVFGIITLVLMIQVNLAHLIWTADFTMEQLKTGWGGGTGADLGVLYPWLVEIICLPAMITGLVYLILAAFKKPGKVLLFFNLGLFIAAVGQYVFTNVFIWY